MGGTVGRSSILSRRIVSHIVMALKPGRIKRQLPLDALCVWAKCTL